MHTTDQTRQGTRNAAEGSLEVFDLKWSYFKETNNDTGK